MKKEETVKNNREFDTIIKIGQVQKNSEFIIYYVSNDKNINRFGISVGKKIGNAVTRNYYKRIIRNMCDINKNLYSNSKDYIIIMRKGLTLLSFDEANKSFFIFIKKINKEKVQLWRKKSNTVY